MVATSGKIQSIQSYIHKQIPLFRYGLAALTVAIGAIVTQYLPVITQRAVFLLFFFAIIQAGFWLGRNPGFFAMALSLPIVNAKILLPLWVSKPSDALILNAGFCIFAVLIIVTTSLQRELTLIILEKQQDLKQAQAIGHVGNWRLDVQRNELFWSDENHRIFGISEGTPMSYETFLSAVHPDDREYVDRKWQGALQGEPYDIEHRVIVANGFKWVRERATLEFDAKGSLKGGFGTTQDITDRKLIELALQENKQRYSGIVESAMDAIITIDANQRILVFNAAAELMFGCTADEALGTSLERFVPHRFHHAHDQHIHAFGRGSITRRIMSTMGVVMGLRSNGEEFPVEVAISHYELHGNKFFTAIIRDIAERQRADSILHEQLKLQDQLAKVAATVPGVIYSFRMRPDGSASLPFVSPAFESIFGLEHDLVKEDMNPFFNRVHPDDFGHFIKTIAESAQTMQPWRETFRYNHPTKGEIWVEGHSMPQRETDGSTFWHGYIQDITDRKRTELALIDRENELRLIMNATPALISYLDTDFRYHKVNKAYENWFCIPQEHILGHLAREIIGEKAWSIVHPYLERARAGERVSFDYQIPYGTGMPRWVSGSYIPDLDSTGNVKGIVVHVVDIEDRKQVELELHKFLSLADNSQEFIGMCDMNFIPFYVNAAGMRLLGLDSLEQTIQIPVPEFFFPEDHDFIMNEFFPRVIEEKRGEVEIRFRHFKTGAAIWMIYNVFYIQNDKGEPIGLATVSRDINARKQVEFDLLESQKENTFLANLIRTSSQPMGIGYPDGRLIKFNLAFEELTGYSAEELQNIDWASELTPPEWHEIERNQLTELQRTGLPVRYEKEYLRKDGTRVPIELLVNLVTDAQGKQPYYSAFLTDITERKLAEKMLRETETRLALVIETVQASYWDWDLNLGKIYSSPEWKRQIGFDGNETLNQSEEWENRLHPEDKAFVMQETEDYLAGHTPVLEVQYRIQHKDGSYRWIHSRGALLRNQEGNPTRMLGINLDITDYMKTKELNERRDEMEKSFRLYVASQTAAAIAHELNQPLTAISYYSYVAQQTLKSDSPNQQKLGKIMEKCGQQAQRAGDVMKQLLTLLHKGETINEPIDINKTVNYALDHIKVDGQFTIFKVALNLTADLPMVTSNAIQLQKVLINLMTNGLESMKERGNAAGMMTVTTGYSPNDPTLALVSVCDSGTGVRDSEAVNKMFQPFYTTKPTGLGMGLAISRTLIEAHGGKMWAEQNTDVGLTIHFTLPFVI